jgi:GTPase SAR1 family protein
MNRILEFNGLPGCGKSTLVNSAILKLKEDGYQASDFLTLLNNNKKAKIRIFWFLRNMNFLEVWDLMNICFSLEKHFDRKQLRRVMIAERICMSYRAIQKSDPTYYLVDQGIVQAIVSIAHTYNIKNEKKFVLHMNRVLRRHPLIAINALSTEHMSCERIRIRNFSDGSRLNFIQDDALLIEELRSLNRNLDFIREHMTIFQININMKNKVEQNADSLCATIMDV